MCCRVSQFIAVRDISFVKEPYVDRLPLHRRVFCVKEPLGFFIFL